MVLEIAREVSRVIQQTAQDAAIIGGVAVVLHGHVRTTVDVDVLVSGDPELFSSALKKAGFSFDRQNREFVKRSVPVHLVLPDQVKTTPGRRQEIDGIITVGLAELMAMKLLSGMSNPLRAQDLADVIALIRVHKLGAAFAAKLPTPLRSEFKKLVRAIRVEESKQRHQKR